MEVAGRSAQCNLRVEDGPVVTRIDAFAQVIELLQKLDATGAVEWCDREAALADLFQIDRCLAEPSHPVRLESPRLKWRGHSKSEDLPRWQEAQERTLHRRSRRRSRTEICRLEPLMESEQEHAGAEKAEAEAEVEAELDPGLEPEPSKQRPLSRLQRVRPLQQKRS